MFSTSMFETVPTRSETYAGMCIDKSSLSSPIPTAIWTKMTKQTQSDGDDILFQTALLRATNFFESYLYQCY